MVADDTQIFIQVLLDPGTGVRNSGRPGEADE